MRIKSAFMALGIALAMVISLDYVSFAAKGRSFLLGKANVVKKQTSLVRAKPGPPLGLYARPGSPPISVNSGVRVPNLNADRVDGYDSSALRTRTWVFTKHLTAKYGNFIVSMGKVLPPGTYLVSYSTSMGSVTIDKPVDCEIVGGNNAKFYEAGQSRFLPGTPSVALSGTGVLPLPAGGSLYVNCKSEQGSFMSGGNPVQVVATRLDVVTQVSAD
jgi:hypothetical protein